MNWIEKLLTPFVVTTSSITMQSLGKIEQRCRCENVVFVCLFFFVTLRDQRAVRSRGYTLSRFCVAVYGSI